MEEIIKGTGETTSTVAKGIIIGAQKTFKWE